MAYKSATSILRLSVFLFVCTYSSVGFPFTDDSFFTYEVSSKDPLGDSQDSFLPDMVFLDTQSSVRSKRQVKRETSPSSPVTPEDEDKSRGVGGRKKVPSGFSTNATNSAKPSKIDGGSSGVFPEKKMVEKLAPIAASAANNSGIVQCQFDCPASATQSVTSSTTPRVSVQHQTKDGKWESHELHAIDGDSGHEPVSENTSADSGEDVKFPQDLANSSVSQHYNRTEDHHQYYNSSSFTMKDLSRFWVDMESNPKATVNTLLSQAHRRAATVALSFDFPFYGHLVRNVTIATGGFLYTGEYVHSWLAATQYIAPLMANFDTSLSNESFVKYVDNGTAFTVEWCKVVLQDRPLSGDFSFQVTLHKNGDIVFVYRTVPILIDKIKDDNHPVKVGLSDAYIIDRTIFFVRRKTIYEYHRVNFANIQNGTVIYLKALPTCLDMKDCTSCLTKIKNFECKWCPSARRCSNGMDRYRQDWLLKGCEPSDSSLGKIKQRSDQCSDDESIISDSNHVHSIDESAIQAESKHQDDAQDSIPIIGRPDHMSDENLGVSISGIIGILLMVVMACSVALWVLYAYRHPHSTSGQWLIRYRPSTWGWRRGEARYTAATIHM